MSNYEIDPTFHLKVKSYELTTNKYKEYRRRWNENPIIYLVEDFPIHIDIETNTTCNLNCTMCFQSFDKPEPIIMEPKLFKKIIDEGANKKLCSIKTQYRGEPLLYKRLPELVEYTKKKGIIEVMFNTNATLLDEKMSLALIKAGLDKIICSIDGYTKEVYENIRIGGNFDLVLNNIKRFQELKKELNSKTPIVRVQMVDTPINHQQIEEYINFWSKIVENVAVEEMLDWKADCNDDTPLNDWSCSQLWQRLFILADGDVMPCCRGIKGGKEKFIVLGNIIDNSLEDIWKGEKLNHLRDLHKKGRSHEIKMCRFCGIRKYIIHQKRIKTNFNI